MDGRSNKSLVGSRSCVQTFGSAECHIYMREVIFVSCTLAHFTPHLPSNEYAKPLFLEV